MSQSRAERGDWELLRAAREDSDAFSAFYCRHAVAVERWLRSQTPDAATAADLTAETFAQVLVSVHRFRGSDDQAARAWLFGIARNLLRRYHRRGRAELDTVRRLGLALEHDSDELERIERSVDAGARAHELSQALQTLPDTHRQAIELRVVDELDYRQAAALMGISEQNARIRVSRALKALFTRLQGSQQ
jgi:RNA polymerase sigma-70 factor (ECF subfamily)